MCGNIPGNKIMVLHNSKWDKKATKRYNKKHGIVPENSQQHNPKDKTDYWKAKKLEGNLWRYQNQDSDDEEKREVNEILGDGSEQVEDHTLKQAGLRPVDDPGELREDYYLPPDEYEHDEEVDKIIREHKPKQAEPKKKLQLTDDIEGFKQLQQDNDRNQFYKNVKRRFEVKKQKQKQVQEDDIDDFLDEIDGLDRDGDEDDVDLSWLKNDAAGAQPETESSSYLDSLIEKR